MTVGVPVRADDRRPIGRFMREGKRKEKRWFEVRFKASCPPRLNLRVVGWCVGFVFVCV